jgi:predicted AlkP superfamily phosphohydrolase/phosphomutase
MAERLMLIGLDGADPDFLLRHMGELPNLARLCRQGVFGRLRSTIPPFTGAAWTALSTGMNPAKTGVVDFLGPGSAQVLCGSSVRAPRLWDVLSARGRPCIVMGVPLTYPVQPLKGVLVSDFLTPLGAQDFTYPEGLRAELPQGYHPAMALESYQGRPGEFLQDLYTFTRRQFEALRGLMKRRPWQLLFYVLSGTDWVQHFFLKPPWHREAEEGMEVLRRYFRFVDALLGELLDEALSRWGLSVMVVSDHGFGKFVAKEVRINVWLRQMGWLRPRRALGPRLRALAGAYMRPLLGRLPFAQALREQAPGGLKARVLKALEPGDGDLSEHTLARFQRAGYNSGYIWLRGDDGALAREILQGLRELRDGATGRPVLQEVYAREEIYSGPYLHMIPHVVMNFASEYAGSEALSGPLVQGLAPQVRPGAAHRMHGVLMAWGEGIGQARGLEASLLDVAPTAYCLLGVPPPPGLDGRVLREVLLAPPGPRAEEAEGLPRGQGGPREGAAQEELKRRLRSLGYL